MNGRNVEALEALIQLAVERRVGYDGLGKWLANQGVLVPSALTNEQMNDIPAHVSPNPYQLVEVLERIAKGENQT